MSSIGKHAVLYSEGYDLTRFFDNLDINDGFGSADTTTFGPDTDEESIPTNRGGDAQGKGLFVQTLLQPIDTVLRAALGVDSVMTFSPLGDNVGSPAILWTGQENNYTVKNPYADAIRTSLKSKANGAQRAGIFLFGKATKTGPFTGTTYDTGLLGELASINWYGHLHVFDCTSDITVLIETSANNVAWVTLTTFTVVSTGVVDGELKSGLGAVHRYRRMRITSGAGTLAVALATDYS